MRLPAPIRSLSLASRLGVALTGILIFASAAQALLYVQTREETIEEADASYQSLAEAIEVAATQIGPEGWRDPLVLQDYTEKLRAKGLREIRVTEGGKPFPDPAPKTAKGRRAAKTRDEIVISGIVGEGATNRMLRLPLVVEGRLHGFIEIKYSLENLREQLAENFRRRLYALVGVFALGLLVMLLITTNATRPIEALADAAARVAEGRLDTRVAVERDDEIGRLATNFNSMTGALRERQDLLARLAAAEKRAEIGHLASGLAHEIKNPLNALSLGLDVLRRRHRPADETGAGEYGARIEALRGEINRLATLINNFLAYGKPLNLSPAPTDLAALVSGTLSDLGETAERARVTIEAAIPSDLPRANVDGAFLKSAVWNLVQNGIQAMERTGGTLGVALRLADEAGAPAKRLELVVEDGGAGIAPADLPLLFEPYFSKREGGVGLGLAMVRRIVEDHGGRIVAENRTDGRAGARFRLTLPTAVPEAAAAPRPEAVS